MSEKHILKIIETADMLTFIDFNYRIQRKRYHITHEQQWQWPSNANIKSDELSLALVNADLVIYDHLSSVNQYENFTNSNDNRFMTPKPIALTQKVSYIVNKKENYFYHYVLASQLPDYLNQLAICAYTPKGITITEYLFKQITIREFTWQVILYMDAEILLIAIVQGGVLLYNQLFARNIAKMADIIQERIEFIFEFYQITQLIIDFYIDHNCFGSMEKELFLKVNDLGQRHQSVKIICNYYNHIPRMEEVVAYAKNKTLFK